MQKLFHQNFRQASTTRGYGIFERFLSLQRVNCAVRLIQQERGNARGGCLVDIGCGMHPIYLLVSKYEKKYGLDKALPEKLSVSRRFTYMPYDIDVQDRLPFEDQYVDVVTLLAVFEHVKHDRLQEFFSDIRRILKSGGVCVVTTPSVWSDGILRIMAKCHLVSPEEIEDHKNNLSTSEIVKIFKQSGFSRVRRGYFECFFNRWFALIK